MRFPALLCASVVVAGGLLAAPVTAQTECPAAVEAPEKGSWPPSPSKGEFDVVHFGEGHWNEGQGPNTMPILVGDVAAFDPRLVLFSSDMADVGSPDRLGCFRRLMDPLVEAGIPWYDSPGNHDRVATSGPGGVAPGAIDVWRSTFASMPAPWGDAEPAGFVVVPEDEPDDGDGASTHYYFDVKLGRQAVARVVVLDNSQHGITSSDADQYPAVGPGQKDASQFAFLARVAAEAEADGLLTFVVMHQPTQDPRDISNAHPTSFNHVMGKGATADNVLFDALAGSSGVDVVLLGHIQGNVEYGSGDVKYFIDGGGGGSPYALREVGTDTGYYYGFRIFRLFRSGEDVGYRTYFVPLIDRIDVEGPEKLTVGDEAAFSATAVQPFDPELPPRLSGVPNEPIELQLRLPDDARVDRAHLPELAYVWKTSDPSILKPIASNADPTDDPVFDAASMTLSGRFEAVGRGVVKITIASGTHRRTVQVLVR